MSKYELVILDADTPVLRAAVAVQKSFIIARHIESGWEQRFDNQTVFWGHWKTKSGGWLKKKNALNEEQGRPLVKAEDFSIEECAELNPEIENHLEKAIEQFDYFVGKIKKLNLADDYLLGIGGSGNFRKDIAQILPYKGMRKDKPLLFAEVKEAIIYKYRNKVVVVNDEEVDDFCAIKGFENYKHFLKTGQWKYVIGFCDKDLEQIISPQFNYLDENPEVFIPTPEQAAQAFCVQCLAGDKGTDNIPGLPNFTEEIREKYSLGKTKGIGKATALKYLEGCKDIKEMFGRVCEAYRSYYGTEKQEFVSWQGEALMWDWLDFLQDNAQLLWLRREEGEMYHITTTLDRLGISYD